MTLISSISYIVSLYRKNFLLAELILSFILVCLVYIYQGPQSHDVIVKWISLNKGEIYPLIATISGTLLGFVITGVSIIMAFTESGKLELLKKSKHYKTIYEVYFNTIKYLAFTTVISIVGLMIDSSWSIYVLYAIIWSVIISSLRLWRCVWILENVIEIITKSANT